jgi:hypothetical protein
MLSRFTPRIDFACCEAQTRSDEAVAASGRYAIAGEGDDDM